MLFQGPLVYLKDQSSNTKDPHIDQALLVHKTPWKKKKKHKLVFSLAKIMREDFTRIAKAINEKTKSIFDIFCI